MATLNRLGADAGMFFLHPELRRLAPPPAFEPLDVMVEQTAIVKLLENMVMDGGIAEAFSPLPISRGNFLLSHQRSESVCVSGVWMTTDTIHAAWEKGVLPEARSQQKVLNLVYETKARGATQWWLCGSKTVAREARTHRLPFLEADCGDSLWLPTYDDKPKESFWQTSIGLCLAYVRLTYSRRF